jgi:ABC-2 type transport system ATP-binding protein
MITTENAVKKFGSFAALDKINCSIPDGCIYGMVGTNGAGKSTFLRLISGVYKADGGKVLADGAPVYENTNVKSQMIFVPDELYFLPGADMNRMAKLYANSHPGFDFDRYDKLTELFGLDPAKNLSTFSKGMKKQAICVLALSVSSKYILFDETFDGLDPVMRNLVKRLVCEDVISRKATAVITSHSLRELEDTCDQLAMLHKGGLVLQSDIQDLKTSLFKVQTAFSYDYDQDKFKGFDILKFTKSGSVCNFLLKGDREQVTEKIEAMDPLFLDILPLSLEEVFTYETGILGYGSDSEPENVEKVSGGEKK